MEEKSMAKRIPMGPAPAMVTVRHERDPSLQLGIDLLETRS
jgi:hypothetical protein